DPKEHQRDEHADSQISERHPWRLHASMESIVEDEHEQFDEQQKEAEAPPAQPPSCQWLLTGIGRRTLAIDVPLDGAQSADDKDCRDDEQDYEHGGWWFVVSGS